MPSNKKSGSFNKQREIEKKRRKKRKSRLIFFIILIIIVSSVTYLMNSQTFKIKNIEVTGNRTIGNKTWRQYIFKYKYNNKSENKAKRIY